MNRRTFLKRMLGLAVLGAAGVFGWSKWGRKLFDPAQDTAAGSDSGAVPAAGGTTAAKPLEAVGGPAADGALLSFVILSDLHVNSGVDYPSRHLRQALDDITHFESKVEAILISGDLTESGTEKDYKELRNVLKDYKLPALHANMGNHDYYRIWINDQGAWSKETSPNGHTDAESRAAFMQFFGLEKPYHDVTLNGIPFLLMSQEAYVESKPEVSEGAWYSDEQMAWLKNKMTEIKDGRPSFVLIHQPLPPQGQDGGAHQLIRAKEFRAALKPVPNVFVFWGHNHQDFRSGTPHYVKETFHGFNNSSVGRVLNRNYQQQNQTLAQGMFVEVFADRVRVRGREFSNRTWIAEADWTVSLKTGKV